MSPGPADRRLLEERLAKAEAALSSGRYDDAIRECQAALELDPGNFACRLAICRALESKGSLRDALGEYQRLASDPAGQDEKRAQAVLERIREVKAKILQAPDHTQLPGTMFPDASGAQPAKPHSAKPASPGTMTLGPGQGTPSMGPGSQGTLSMDPGNQGTRTIGPGPALFGIFRGGSSAGRVRSRGRIAAGAG